jgi:hypothetical protein
MCRLTASLLSHSGLLHTCYAQPQSMAIIIHTCTRACVIALCVLLQFVTSQIDLLHSVTAVWIILLCVCTAHRWVCRDFPDLKLAVEKFILNSFEPTSYDSMKQLCERYNRAVSNIKKLWSGRQPPPGIDAPPSIPLLRHIINQAYSRAVNSPEDLNSYEPFSPEVYGETSFELVCEVIKLTKMTENDVFLDLGSGVGQIVLQVAAKVGCKCYGVEKADIPAKFARVIKFSKSHSIPFRML